MTVKVTIEYLDPEDENHPLAKRVLTIDRAQPRNVVGWDDVVSYDVMLAGPGVNRPGIAARGVFDHRYGDDLLTLTAEAIDSLGRGGMPELRR